MGTTEEFRKRQGEPIQPGCPSFKPDPAIEACLRQAVEMAETNLRRYLQRVRKYNVHTYQVQK